MRWTESRIKKVNYDDDAIFIDTDSRLQLIDVREISGSSVRDSQYRRIMGLRLSSICQEISVMHLCSLSTDPMMMFFGRVR